MFDVPSNHKIGYLRAHASQEIGAANQLEIDLQEQHANGLFERNSTLLVIVEVTDVTGGTLDLVAQDADEAGTWDADFATIDQIDATGVYYFVVKGARSSFRLRATVATHAVVWGAFAVSFDAERRPVKQSDATALDVTYSTGR